MSLCDKEVWAPIPSWPLYEASNLGRVRSWNGKCGVLEEPVILKCFMQCNRRYLRVNLYRNRKIHQRGVHRLVMEAFNGHSSLQVNHIDGDPQNNRLENLEYCTARHNQLHAVRLGLSQPNKGEANGAAKLTQSQVAEIRARHVPYRVSYRKLAGEFGVCEGTVAKIVQRKLWSHVS